MIELHTLVISIFASVLGDQILIMILTGALHLLGRACTAPLAPDDPGMRAPEGAMTPPQHTRSPE